ncbi:hypothetical protein THUN1379_09660 [Paludibacterium sp. THUN1379]|uniref:calcium-binding protein n=1 Tax=Paludibacterium sp. THUN1379 TaxID=3112107 RepID=UPI00308B16ED|nr:hypothetical protein THUN1379_09660 [Paludibacterium sp. THUN1379]
MHLNNPHDHQPAKSRPGSPDITLIGTDDDDVLTAGRQAVNMQGLDGDDLLRGSPHDDLQLGGRGDDFLQGLGGNDTQLGGEGDDILHGDAGHDRQEGGSGDDLLFGHQGNDVLDGGAGDDVLDGGPGEDLLRGGPGDDHLAGGGGRDILLWHAQDMCGDDQISGFEPGEDQIWLPLPFQPGEAQYAQVKLESREDQSVLRIQNNERHCQINIRFADVDLSDGGSLSEQQALSRLLMEGPQAF